MSTIPIKIDTAQVGIRTSLLKLEQFWSTTRHTYRFLLLYINGPVLTEDSVLEFRALKGDDGLYKNTRSLCDKTASAVYTFAFSADSGLGFSFSRDIMKALSFTSYYGRDQKLIMPKYPGANHRPSALINFGQSP
ncbi:Nucleoside-triphosphatase [Penicillium cf. griseofulvum]|uniref:Nucleoside-triphosphatase n=1 Tax=Penicillium cf. griseofulvum TaxID=2972120 RepID=A0A9W9MSN5_9EURO|nr:Nucleoside-triphosphatase [Penicillium cf. griseofulvum]KAJ5448240.1 Nucleoside-triphosphatase [Penicillium cf. griseofulvum]